MEENLFKASALYESFPTIIAQLPITLEIAVISAALGLAIGFLIAIIKIYKICGLQQLCTFYVSFMRGTPQLVQLFLSYYGLPLIIKEINYAWGLQIDINGIPAIAYVFIAFGLNEAAYNSETIRAAILSVDLKEIEAAKSIGMSRMQMMRRIILPKALVVAVPNLGNSFISLLKGTSLAFTVTVMDIMGAAKMITGRNMRFFEVYIMVAIVYWVCCIVIEFFIHYLEKKLDINERFIQSTKE
jgi:polar amino acid transport system permease protein